MDNLVIKGSQGWEFVFRKERDRPIEMLKRHNEKGNLGGWQVARNFCLRALVNRDDLSAHFGESKL